MFDRNRIEYCGVCDCVTYRHFCGHRACDCTQCEDCKPVWVGVWAWLDKQNIDKETLKKTGRLETNNKQQT